MYDAINDTKPLSHYEYQEMKPSSFLLVANTRLDFVEEQRKQALAYVAQLKGCCSELKAKTLFDLVWNVKPGTIVEIGTLDGKSLIAMACALRANDTGTIFGIASLDRSVGMQGLHPNAQSSSHQEEILQNVSDKIDAFGLRKQIFLMHTPSQEVSALSGIDLLHIDGNRLKSTSYFHLKEWTQRVKSGGWILFDDRTMQEDGTLTSAEIVQWLDEQCVRIATCDTWGIWAKP